jgi:hypothetical protein
MENNVKIFLKTHFDQFEKMDDLTDIDIKEWFDELGKLEAHGQHISNHITKCVRMIYQENLLVKFIFI